MGVTYKLKREVIDFIVAYKSKEPDISCRKLVDIVRKKFNVKVSKSSINTIFKSANLSSPVGRRSISKKRAKRFQIPEEKIQELFPDEKKEIFTGKSAETAPVKMSKEKPLENKSVKKEKQQETAILDNYLIEEGAFDFLGTVFLKSAINELTGGSILNRIFSSYLKEEFSLKKSNPDSLLFYELFGGKKAADLKKDTFAGICKINELSDVDEMLNLAEMTGKEPDLKKMKLAVAIELPQLFKEVESIDIYTNDDKHIRLDGAGFFIWGDNPPAGLAAPVYTSVLRVSEEIIENVQTWRIPFITDRSIDMFGHLCEVIENTNKVKLDKIELKDYKNNEIASFPYLPDKKRTVWAGVLPTETVFNIILKAAKPAGKFNEIVADQKYYYRESTIPFNAVVMTGGTVTLKALFIYRNGEERPFLAVLSNDNDLPNLQQTLRDFIIQTIPAIGGFKHFLKNEKGANDVFKKAYEEKAKFYQQRISLDYDITQFISGVYNFKEIYQTIFDQLNIFCQYRYFPVACAKMSSEEMIKNFYALPGVYKETNNFIEILFKKKNLPHESREYLSFAAKRINEEKIFLKEKKLLVKSE